MPVVLQWRSKALILYRLKFTRSSRGARPQRQQLRRLLVKPLIVRLTSAALPSSGLIRQAFRLCRTENTKRKEACFSGRIREPADRTHKASSWRASPFGDSIVHQPNFVRKKAGDLSRSRQDRRTMQVDTWQYSHNCLLHAIRTACPSRHAKP